jgi:KaiC/GvpD/RAD55 family RecA-like ATPase
MPKIPLIEDLTAGPIPAGSVLLVEFSGASQWYNTALTIAAGWLKQGGKVSYNAMSQPPDDIRTGLGRLGVNCDESEKGDKLRIWDWYTATLGKKSNERYSYDSLKVADISVRMLKDDMRQAPQADWLRIIENTSTWYRFNDEKPVMELELTRFIPSFKLRNSTAVRAIMRDVQSNWVVQQLEGAHDGIIDLKLDETTDPAQNMIRIRSMRNVGFDGRWHRLRMGENFEAALEK